MEYQSTETPNVDTASTSETTKHQPFYFQNHFEGTMTMQSDVGTVKEYLNAHQGWFVRCAKPMQAELIGENSYALNLGHFRALGFELEPKFGVELLPEEEGVYRMETVPVERADADFYEVDYQAELQLVENSTDEYSDCSVTGVEWTLDLGVTIYFPRFIYRFPKSMVQKTGDRLLKQIVRQVSRHLTHKVQVDFHSRYDLALPFQEKT
jgi:hypothetical protein